MLVERIAYGDLVLDTGRRFAKSSGDRCFSAEDVAGELDMNADDALRELTRLEDEDWVVMWEDDSTPPVTSHSRWLAREHKSLTLGQSYEVLGICADRYRILDDRNDPVLFDPSCFRVVDDMEPHFWVSTRGEEGERYAGPKNWAAPGFFEDFHDGVRSVRAKFWSDVRELYPRTREERGHITTS